MAALGGKRARIATVIGISIIISLASLSYLLSIRESDQEDFIAHDETEDEQCILVWTPRHTFPEGRTVKIYLTNICNRTLYGTPQFKVFNSNDEMVYCGNHPMVIMPLEPGHTWPFPWRQHDDHYNQVPAGLYYAYIKFSCHEDTTEYFAIGVSP